MNDFIKIGLAAAVVALVVMIFVRRGNGGSNSSGDITSTLGDLTVQSGAFGSDSFISGLRGGVDNWTGLSSLQPQGGNGPFRNISS